MNKKYSIYSVVVLSMILFAAIFTAIPTANAEPEEVACAVIDGGLYDLGWGRYQIVVWIATHGCCAGSGYMMMELWIDNTYLPPVNIGYEFTGAVFYANYIYGTVDLHWTCTSLCGCGC
jgi:hypothetical protein